mmetsp:Transcript_24760/g.48416  ORF Transcript_24760/g.48416 Transcript_24760/m.48416 type:complete len:80 (-) Transcript_24760:48-287(-)
MVSWVLTTQTTSRSRTSSELLAHQGAPNKSSSCIIVCTIMHIHHIMHVIMHVIMHIIILHHQSCHHRYHHASSHHHTAC